MVNSADILSWRETDDKPALVEPWKPYALAHDEWPPNYKAVYAWRIKTLAMLRADPSALKSAKAYYRKNRAEFILHWMDTYDPRRTSNKWIPFVFFIRQRQMVHFLDDCRNDGQNGLVEKCRDAGATWISCAYSIACWLFIKEDAIGWGSRKQDLVDKLGNPDSIFEKMRLLLRRLPAEFLPKGFSQDKHATFMKFINPENGSVIIGEAGDNIGRGGRTSIYFKDEAAHYERAEKIEAALADNTNVQIDISSVNGLGNVFHRRRESGVIWTPGAVIEKGFVRVFIIDWRDHPAKTQEWYDTRYARHEREGMLHLFAQEVDRNYAASVQNTIIDSLWIAAAVDAHKHIRWRDDKGNIHIGLDNERIGQNYIAGLDVADEGLDRNACAIRQDIILRDVEEWGERDVGSTTRRTIAKCREFARIKVQYDCIGVGAGVKSEYNRLIEEKLLNPEQIKFVPWNAGAAVEAPYDRVISGDNDSPLNKDFFYNRKAQAWWSVRSRFYKTYKNIKDGVIYPVDELISLDGSMPLLHQLMKEFAQPTKGESTNLRTLVNKKPDGTKSPNLADAAIQAFFPVDETAGQAIVGTMGG